MASGLPQMFIWNCQDCPYGTKVTRAGLVFDESSGVTGDIKVNYIIAEDGDSSLEVRGPLEGNSVSRIEVRIHEGGSCSNPGEVMYAETCKNCHNYVSMKVLSSRYLLTVGGENDVLGRPISVYDARRGTMLGCGTVEIPSV